MASAKLVFNEDEVRRLQSKIGQVSQDTNRLYLQLKGQSSSWGGIPMGDPMVRAQVLINELTVEAEKLEDIIRVALRGVSELQEENKRQADKLTGQFNLLLAAFGNLGLQPPTGRVSIPEFVQRSATNLITSIAALSGKDELSRDPVVQQLRNVIQTSGLLSVESIAAQSKLNDIFAARNQIAKAQMAFKVYQAFGNQAQMEAVHAQAEGARQKLASLGVAKIYYEAGKDLSTHYRQPAVTACEYDPSITADKVPLLHNEEYLLLLRLAMEKTAAGAYARSQLAAKRQEIQIAAALKQVQEQLEAERRLNGPPLALPDGTPITADNKENETTWDFYVRKVHVPSEFPAPIYTLYAGWLDETYGLTTVESRIRQSGDVVLAFTEGWVKEVVMGVADTVSFAFKLVVDPVKTTTEMKQQAQYLIDHPEVLVEAAKMAYHQFDEATPEEKAKMLGSVASILVPGLQVTKAGKVGKVLGEVEDVVSQAAKEALQGIKQKLPNLGPVVQTPEGFVFKIGEIPDTPALPKTPVQQKYMDAVDGEGGKVEGPGKVDTPPAFKQTEFASSYESRLNQTPSPNNKTVSFEGQRGETKCILKPPPDPELKKILDEAGIDGINYKNGVPDFSPVAKAQLEIDHMVGGVGSNGTKARAANFKQADIKLAEQLNNSPELASQFGLTPGKIKAGDIADIREELKLTWHELNDGKIIQLVPSEINSKFGHLGGVGEINAGAFEPGGFAN